MKGGLVSSLLNHLHAMPDAWTRLVWLDTTGSRRDMSERAAAAAKTTLNPAQIPHFCS